MYLSDRDIKAELEHIRFETDHPDHPFDAEAQVQPASVDLRLDRVFWRQRSRKEIDLRRARLLELSPRRYWTKLSLGPGESVVLRPGEMLLGRTYEVFTVPASCAGKLEGRSSFSRMGLAVHCSGDFINPGYRGHMPLQLVNLGRGPLRVFPFVPICQLVFVKLSSVPERTYGACELSSKYMDDDGGPSYWWRDKRIRELQTALGEFDVAERIQTELLEVIGPREPELIERFERFVRRLRSEDLTNSADLLERFAKQEDHDRRAFRLKRGILVSLAPVLIACSIGSFFSQPFGWTHYGWIHYLLWCATAITIPVSVWAFQWEDAQYFGERELEVARRS